MRRQFTYQALPMRVVFGAGALSALPDEVRALGMSRVLVLCSPEQEPTGRTVAAALGTRAAGVFPHARMHVPIEVARQARTVAAELGADGCVAVGGGSAIGLGKAIALEQDLPVIAVPTTYAGSEMTPVWGLTEAGEKRTGRDVRVLPRGVVYDPELTLTLPTGALGHQRDERDRARRRGALRPRRDADRLADGRGGGAGHGRGPARDRRRRS